MPFPNSSLTDIVATTIESRSGKIADNVVRNNALLSWLKKNGGVKTVSGGSSILEEISFADNGNFGWYSGYDLLPVAAQDVISAAQYSLKQCAVPVVISGLEQLQNSGKEAIIDLLESRITVAESTMANKISEGIYGDGTGSGGKTIDGLAKAIVETPTASATYGGINRSTWPFWRNRYLGTNGAFASTTIQGFMNKLYSNLVRGSEKPDLIVVDSVAWQAYVASLQTLLRFTSSDSANLGFDSVKFMNSDVVLDGGLGGFAPASTMYFINTKYLKFRPHKDRNMVPLSPQRRVSINQDAQVEILAWAGNLTCSNQRAHGLLNINATAEYLNTAAVAAGSW